MVRWIAPQGTPQGFTYTPTWEVAVGWLLIVVALATPVLYFRLNDAAARGILESVFCIAFTLFFLLLGKSLAFQSFRALLNGQAVLSVAQDLRSPATEFTRAATEWRETRIGKATDEAGREFAAVLFVGSDGPHELYRTIDPGEARIICEALEDLRKSPLAVPK
ncbi:MAG TPA: hypothetical protein PLP29_16665 [Candidatus Ozemobacteraceae bacterium]|nr:hypothetical protein [Candidatus Ozemobacteraceae bacterium]